KPVKDERLLLAADIQIGKSKVGLVGQLLPQLTRPPYDLDLEHPVVVAEIPLKKLANALSESTRFTELPKFPAITRDVAIDAPIDLENQQISDYFNSTNQQLLESFALFDVFADPSGEKIAADRKSLAYSLTYRDLGGTLKSETVDAAHAEILNELKKHLPVQFR
ncbi:MAG: phenylalanine--tRNA ligase subunit beta, partial [Verrucomicrobiota bacterium]